jgi:hypothetical protein
LNRKIIDDENSSPVKVPMFTANNNNPFNNDEMNRKHLNVMTNNLFSMAQAVRVSTRAIFPFPEQFSSIIERVFAKCFIHNFLLTGFSVFVFASSLDHKTTTQRARERKVSRI